MRELKFCEMNSVAGGIPITQPPLPPVTVWGNIYGYFDNLNLQTLGLSGGYIAAGPGQGIPMGSLAAQIISTDFAIARNSNTKLAFPDPNQSGTLVNASLICSLEGGNLAVAYNDGSGNITVGCGINITDMSQSELNAIGDQSLTSMLGPYLGKSVAMAAANGLPDFALTQQQTDELFNYSFNQDINSAESIFSNFNGLPSSVQTVITDIIWNAGSGVFTAGGNGQVPWANTYSDIVNQDWGALINELNNPADWLNDQNRRGAEGLYLEAALGYSTSSGSGGSGGSGDSGGSGGSGSGGSGGSGGTGVKVP